MGAPPSSSAVRGGRRNGQLGAFLVASGLALTIGGSLATGPCFDEERRFGAVRHATDLFRALSDYGPGTLVSSSARAIYDELSPFGVLPGLVSAWLGEVLTRAHWVDAMTGARLGWLLVTGLAPAAVYFIVEASRGARVAALAACLLVGMPRWTHAASAAREPAIATSLWLLLLAAYLRSFSPTHAARRAGRIPGNRWAAFGFAAALGLALAADLATLWVLPAVVLHYFWAHRRTAWSAMRRGRAPLPAAFLWTLVVSPLVLALGTPMLWRGGAASAAEWLFAPLAPTIEHVVYRGPVVSIRDVPVGYAVHFLVATIPVALLLLAVGGALVMGRDAFLSRRGARALDERGLGALCLMMTLSVVIGPMVTPRVLTLFPPRVEAALPFVAIAAAVALERVATRVVGERRATWAVLGSSMIAMGIGLSGLATASAAFNVFSGGAKGAIASRIWTVGDGSEVAVLARAIDALGAPSLTVQSADVPRSYWPFLVQAGRLRTRVDGARGNAGELVVVRGANDHALARVDRDRTTLWSLTRR